MHFFSVYNICCIMFSLSYLVDVAAARQIGFKDASEVPVLCILAQDLLRRSKECDENIYEYICSVNGSNAYSLYMNLMDEFERCVNSYLAFHWNQVTHVINLVFILSYLVRSPIYFFFF